MHVSLIVLSLGLAIALRYQWRREPDAVPHGEKAFTAFLVPPTLLLLTAIAVLKMGTEGTMFCLPVGWLGYLLGIGFLGLALLRWGLLGWQGWRSLRHIRSQPLVELPQAQGRLLATPALFAGQVGFWNPELVISEGLLAQLTPEQLEAVLTHEQAHRHYRDTFWYFWLGWLRHLTGWLPNTQVLWQELLLLRELRADRWAAQSVDPLVLAETLLQVARSPLQSPIPGCVALNDAVSQNRLALRIDGLLATQPPATTTGTVEWLKWLWIVLPVLSIAFHA